MEEVLTKREAQQRADRIHAFRAEVEALANEGVIDLGSDVRERVQAYHEKLLASFARRFDIDTTESERQVSIGMRAAAIVGAAALCAAVVLFFNRYWGVLGTSAQALLLITVPAALVVCAEIAARRERRLYFTSLLCAIGFAAFVTDLNVLGATFNVTPTHHALLAWGAFGLALGYRYGLRLQLAAGLTCAVLWCYREYSTMTGMAWGMFYAEGMLAAGIGLCAIASLAPHHKRPGFAAIYSIVGLCAVYVALMPLSITGETLLPLDRRTAQTTYQVVGQLGAAAGIWWGISRRMPAVVNLSAAGFTALLYARLIDWLWDWMPRYLFFFAAGLLALALLAAFRRLRSRLREVDA